MKVLGFLMFNFITRLSFRKRGLEKLLNNRLSSISVDFGYLNALLSPIIAIICLCFILEVEKNQQLNFLRMNNLIYGLLVLLISLILNKDIFQGRSIGKRILGYQVIDIKSNNIPSDFKLMIRNITVFIWPVEVVWILKYPSRRLGDIIAGTMVIKCDKIKPETLLDDIGEKQLDNNTVITLLVSFLISISWIMILIIKF